MTEPKWLYGRMHFEDGVRPVLMCRGTKYFHAFFLDSCFILRRYVLFKELKYFTEWANINTDPKIIKQCIRKFLNKSKIHGLSRQMTKAIKRSLQSGLELCNEK